MTALTPNCGHINRVGSSKIKCKIKEEHMKNYPSIRAFISYVSTFKGAFWLNVATFAVADAVLAAIPWLVGQLTGSLTEYTTQGDGGPNDMIMFWTLALIATSVVHDSFWRLSEYVYYKLVIAHTQRFDDVIFNAVMRHNYSFFVDKFTGKVSSYANSLGREFRELLENFLWNYLNSLVLLPLIALTMFTVNVYTGLIFVISLLMMFLVGRNLARSAAASERVEADERSSMEGYVVDVISNFVSVKAFRNENHETGRLYGQRHSLIGAARHSFKKSVYFWAVMSLFIRWIIWPSTLLLNVYLFTHGMIDLAQMTTFLTAIVLFSNFIWEVIWNISQINIKVAKIEEAYRYLFGIRNIVTELPAGSGAGKVGGSGFVKLRADAFKKSLELRDVGFAYPDKPDAPILRDINLTIRHGEKIGVIGPSGGGKSTLLKILLGYYPMPAETLRIDGKPTDVRSLTDLIAYVPQDTTIFHRSIRDNIAYARPDASHDEIIVAAKHAQAHDFITALDSGYDTTVGERGIKLSGGQRQRIAIARAILKDAPILLLDEATSALDSESEKLIQAAFDDLLIGHTALVIAHRLSTIQKMDRIIVFDDGMIVEEGSHQQLIAQDGLYARLWSHQTDGFIKD